VSYLDGPHCYALHTEKWVGQERVASGVLAIYSTNDRATRAQKEYESSHWPDGMPEGWRTVVVLYPMDLHWLPIEEYATQRAGGRSRERD